MSQVAKQSSMVKTNHRCDVTDDAQNDASRENGLAGVPISMVPCAKKVINADRL